MKQWIDIIIPAYNAHSTLGKTLASIAIQTMAHEVRVIIIDDHSKTGYEDIIAPYKNILDIVLITNKENLGCGASRNIGLENAKNKYIMFIDADDMLKEYNSIEKLWREVYENSTINAVYSPIEQIEDNRKTDTIPANHFVWLLGSLYNRSFIEKNQIRFANTSSGEDVGFNRKVRMLSAPEQIKFIQEPTYLWTNMNFENRINSDKFGLVYSKVGYVESLYETEIFLKDKFKPATQELLKYEFLGNVIASYFSYILVAANAPTETNLVVEPFRKYFYEAAPIYGPLITKDDYIFVYQDDYYNRFKNDKFPLGAISFDDFIDIVTKNKERYITRMNIDCNKLISFIIPNFNSANTLNRTLRSIEGQGLEKEKYEVIICDNNSTDSSAIKANSFPNINIRFYSEQFNTIAAAREYGLSKAEGEWVTFIDADDTFILDTLRPILELIRINQLSKVCYTSFVEYDFDAKKKTDRAFNKDNWLYGKFYNREFLIQNSIHFNQNQKAYEDTYFSNQVNLVLTEDERKYYDIISYNWSAKERIENREYLQSNFNDYLLTVEPYFNFYNNNRVKCLYEIIKFLLQVYFFVQVINCNKEKILNQILSLGLNKEQLIEFIYTNPKTFSEVRAICEYEIGYFVEKESFKDFINK